MTKKGNTGEMAEGYTGLRKKIASCLRNYCCEKTGNGIKATADFNFPADFPAFKGHFPTTPILPGVIELYALRHLASTCLGCKLTPVESDHIKFNSQVGPGETIHLSLTLTDQGEGLWKTSFQFTGDDRKISSGVIILK